MQTKLPLSVFIIALNEADRIGATISAAREISDEIIVIDSGSTDDTVAVCEAAGARVMHNAWAGYGLQKRFGEDQCRHDWLLNLDADEVPSPELIEEIKALFAGNIDAYHGYRLPICHMLPGETQVPRFTQINRGLRLYNKKYGRFSDSPVHDSVQMDESRVAHLKSPVYHRSFRSIAHAIDKLNHYSSMQAHDMITRGKKVSSLRICLEFPACFIKSYVIRGYMFRGLRGFNYAIIYAFSRFARLAKWHELKHTSAVISDKNN